MRSLLLKSSFYVTAVLAMTGMASVVSAADTWPDMNRQVIEYYQKKYYTKAIPVAKNALALAEKTYGAQSPEAVLSMNNLAMLYKKKKNYTEAEKLYLRALESSEKIVGRNHPDLSVPMNNLSMLYAHQGRYAEAQKFSNRAVSILETHYGRSHPHSIEARKRAEELKLQASQV